MKTNHTVRLAMLAFTTLLFAWKEPVVGKNQRGVSTRQRRKACVGWLGGMEDLGGIIAVGFSLENDLKDECSFKLKEDIVLLVATKPNGSTDILLAQDKDEKKRHRHSNMLTSVQGRGGFRLSVALMIDVNEEQNSQLGIRYVSKMIKCDVGGSWGATNAFVVLGLSSCVCGPLYLLLRGRPTSFATYFTLASLREWNLSPHETI
jgi:hypothetical protein